jgi:uncharacterized protein YutE (UPF0331/DUF86 family)
MLGLGTTIPRYSIKKTLVAEQIREIIRAMQVSSDTETTGCHFTFSNEQYDKMLAKAKEKHRGKFILDGNEMDVNFDALMPLINEISSDASRHVETETIIKVLKGISTTLAGETYEEIKDSWLDRGIINEFIHHMATEIALQILTPKVTLLLYINSYVMGKIVYDTKGEIMSENQWMDDLYEQFMNLVRQTVTEITDLIVKRLYEWLIQSLTPLIEKFILKLTLEKIKYYRELITQLIRLSVGIGRGIRNANMGSGMHEIDNVDYADIVPTQISPQICT